MEAGGKVDGLVPSDVFGVLDMVSSSVPPLAISVWRNQI